MKEIFIVDDEPIIHILYNRIFARFGNSICGEAFNGQEAVEKIREMEKHPDIIIMDHRMPIMSGLDATKEILSMDPEINIIFISADMSVKDEVLKEGVHSFVIKPFDFSELVGLVKDIDS